MHNKIYNKYYFINKLDTNYIDKQDKETFLLFIEIIALKKIRKLCNFKNKRCIAKKKVLNFYYQII